MSETIKGPLIVTLEMRVNPDNTVTVTKLNLTSNTKTDKNIEAINTAVNDEIIKNNNDSLHMPLLPLYNNDDNENPDDQNNGTYEPPVAKGGKRRRKTSKRSSGGKRKTSKYQKRKSGKYRQ